MTALVRLIANAAKAETFFDALPLGFRTT